MSSNPVIVGGPFLAFVLVCTLAKISDFQHPKNCSPANRTARRVDSGTYIFPENPKGFGLTIVQSSSRLVKHNKRLIQQGDCTIAYPSQLQFSH